MKPRRVWVCRNGHLRREVRLHCLVCLEVFVPHDLVPAGGARILRLARRYADKRRPGDRDALFVACERMLRRGPRQTRQSYVGATMRFTGGEERRVANVSSDGRTVKTEPIEFIMMRKRVMKSQRRKAARRKERP